MLTVTYDIDIVWLVNASSTTVIIGAHLTRLVSPNNTEDVLGVSNRSYIITPGELLTGIVHQRH